MPHETYMKRCLALAERAKGYTSPNPMVGAVLVHNDRIIGEGWHHHYGADHAEVNCLKNVADTDKSLIPESTMYVNLEPCAHYGITPPCADRLVQEKVKKIIIANKDPFEKVAGKGMEILKDGGVVVAAGTMEREGLWLNRRFFCFHREKRPYIILKWAQTSDGFIAAADKKRLQLTNPESQKLLHKWRTEEAAIMVGWNTALNDNPQLTARLWPGKQPLRIALDRGLHLPPTHHLFDGAAATWIINDQREILQGNVHSVFLPFDDTLLPHLMQRLFDARMISLIVEGGAELLNSFIKLGLWDEARIFTGDMSIGDGIAAPAINCDTPAFTREIASDKLDVYVNTESNYPYVAGMEL